MSAVSDIIALLDRWPRWKAVTEAPDRIEALEKRVADLEAKLSAKPVQPSGPACPICGEPMKTTSVQKDPLLGVAGVQQHRLQCVCGHTETRQVSPR